MSTAPCQPPIASDGSPFVGHQWTLAAIKAMLDNTAHAPVVIIDGVQRLGKTSLLKQFLQLPGYICVYYNFQRARGVQEKRGVPTSTVFYELTKEIVLACHATGIRLDLPKLGVIHPSLPKRELAGKMYESLRPAFEQTTSSFELFELLVESIIHSLRDKRLLLLLDEFDKVQSGIESGVTSPQVVDNFRNLFHTYPQVSAILTGSQLMKRLRREHFEPLFNIGRRIPIVPLDPAAAGELVEKLHNGVLVYSYAARDWIVDACACQPFLIQHVCSRVFDICADTKELNVTTDIAKKAAELWLKNDTHFDTVWRDDIHDPRGQYVAWVIHELDSGSGLVTFDLIREVLGKRGLSGANALTDHLAHLRDLTVIRCQAKEGTNAFGIAIPLFAEWLHVRIDPASYLIKALNQNEGKL